MERIIKVAIFPGSLTQFANLLPKIINASEITENNESKDRYFDLSSYPDKFVNNIFSTFDSLPYENEAILSALQFLMDLNFKEEVYQFYAIYPPAPVDS